MVFHCHRHREMLIEVTGRMMAGTEAVPAVLDMKNGFCETLALPEMYELLFPSFFTCQ